MDGEAATRSFFNGSREVGHMKLEAGDRLLFRALENGPECLIQSSQGLTLVARLENVPSNLSVAYGTLHQFAQNLAERSGLEAKALLCAPYIFDFMASKATNS